MNNFVCRKFTVSEVYQPLVTTPLVATVTLSTPPSNTGIVYFLGDDGSDVPWVAGEFHELRRVDLSKVKAKGTAGNLVTIVGGTW